MTTCIMCEEPTEATIQLGDWDVCDAHAAAVTTPDPAETVELVCAGSGQAPQIKRGKPHCRVCGERFRWQDLEDCVQFIPEHF